MLTGVLLPFAVDEGAPGGERPFVVDLDCVVIDDRGWVGGCLSCALFIQNRSPCSFGANWLSKASCSSRIASVTAESPPPTDHFRKPLSFSSKSFSSFSSIFRIRSIVACKSASNCLLHDSSSLPARSRSTRSNLRSCSSLACLESSRNCSSRFLRMLRRNSVIQPSSSSLGGVRGIGFSLEPMFVSGMECTAIEGGICAMAVAMKGLREEYNL